MNVRRRQGRAQAVLRLRGDNSPVSDIQLFGGLPEAELRRLFAVARRRRFDQGEVVFHQGDPADSLHLVLKGRFAARATTRLGDALTVAIHSPGEAFGELALVEAGAMRSMTVAAVEAGETLAVNRGDFDRVRHTYPEVNEVLVRLLAARVRHSSDRLLEALFAPAETRVLRRLHELMQLYGRAEPARSFPSTRKTSPRLPARRAPPPTASSAPGRSAAPYALHAERRSFSIPTTSPAA